jgi:hypothetical protein
VEVFVSFFNLWYSSRVSQGGKDKLCWVLSKRGLFDVRLFYNVIVPHDETPFGRVFGIIKFSWSDDVYLVGCPREDSHHG